MYTRDGTSWNPMGAHILGSAHGMTGVGFGSALALSWDGLTLAVGTRGNQPPPPANQAVVLVWNENNNAWERRGNAFTNAPSLGVAYEIASPNVALSADGQTFAFGAPGGDYVQVFGWYGTEWRQMG